VISKAPSRLKPRTRNTKAMNVFTHDWKPVERRQMDNNGGSHQTKAEKRTIIPRQKTRAWTRLFSRSGRRTP